MAEELQPAPGEELDPNAAPVEGEDDTDQQPDPIEEFAKSELGWAPQAEFRGEPADWKPAAEFIKAGREITRSMGRELKSVREEVSRMARTSADMTAQALAERDTYWQGIHRQAVEEGNVEVAERAHTERMNLKAQAPQPDANAEPPETLHWRDRHKEWFGKNRLATGRAMEVAERSRQMGATPAEQLEDAEQAVRREFPELFKAPAKQPPGVQTGQARNNGGGSRKKGYADMPTESRAMADDYEKRHGVPKEKFAESYFADQERKVG